MKTSKLSETPYFFSVTVQDKTYMFAAYQEDARSAWLKYIRNLAVNELDTLSFLPFIIFFLFYSAETER
jgi:hypothetical protein